MLRAADIAAYLKPGLWQTTTSVQTAGGLPMSEADLAQLPPEKRAQFEAAMKAAMAESAQPHTFVACLTAEQLHRQLAFNLQDNPGCKRTVVATSASRWEMHETCGGASQRTTTARFQATSPEEITGETQITMIKAERRLTSKGSIHSQWLGSDCGHVKPGADIQQPSSK
jgi:hypothetical protein